MQQRKYGWKKSIPDASDKFHMVLSAPRHLHVTKVDMRPLMPHVYDQGSLGSCTANAIAGAYEYDEIKDKEKSAFTPSRLGIYWCERKLEGSIDEDAGATLTTGMTVLKKFGVFPEEMWPYIESKFKQEPPQKCFDIATKHNDVMYRRVKQTMSDLKNVLISNYPIMFGFMVYEGMESETVAKTGILHMPKPNETSIGGHAVLIVGFDDSVEIDKQKGAFIVRNSWGNKWGLDGYFYMPYAYVLDPKLCDDFWTLTFTN